LIKAMVTLLLKVHVAGNQPLLLLLLELLPIGWLLPQVQQLPSPSSDTTAF